MDDTCLVCGGPKKHEQIHCNICFEGFSKCNNSEEREEFTLQRIKDVRNGAK